MRTLSAVLVAAALVGCASIEPAPVRVGQRCVRCRQPVSELRLASEIIDNMQAPFVFRTPGCMAKYVKANGAEGVTAIFVTDYRTGRMVPASEAWFVPAQVAAPDGGRTEDYLAFRSRLDADASRAHNEPLLRWTQVVAEAPSH